MSIRARDAYLPARLCLPRTEFRHRPGKRCHGPHLRPDRRPGSPPRLKGRPRPGAAIAGPAAVELRNGTLPDAAVDWLKTNFLKTELELSRCLRTPAEGPCECDLHLTCAKFVTTPEYSPGSACGRDREVERHRCTSQRIERLLTDLGEPLDSPGVMPEDDNAENSRAARQWWTRVKRPGACEGNAVEARDSFGHAGPVTPDIDSLVPSSASTGDWRNTAVIGGPWESDSALAVGFFELADEAVERWKAGHRNDAIVIPIICNYRHGIELALKEGIRQAAGCLRRDGVTGPDVQADEIDQQLSATHSIDQLVNRLTALLGQLQLGQGQEIPAETLDVLGKLHVLDQNGQAFRYSAMKTGPRGRRVLEQVRPGQQHFDIVAVGEALRDAGTMLLYGLSGVLGVYSDWQDDMADWYACGAP